MPEKLIEISNNGPEISSTNYWQSAPGTKGLCYLSANAGTMRLLIPSASAIAHTLEILTSKRVTIERSIQQPGAWDVVFEDDSDSPYFIAMDPQLIDRPITPGKCRLAVWTEQGKAAEFDCTITA